MSDSHVVVRRTTSDGVGVEIWSDGAVLGRLGFVLPGVPVARPRTQEGLALARGAAALLAGEVELYDVSELPRLAACARQVAARGGLPGDLRAAFASTLLQVRFVWETYTADRNGRPLVRVARLDRIRWPGLAVWHESGRYELMTVARVGAPGVRSGEVLEPTGISFGSQRELVKHLLTEQVTSQRHRWLR